MSAGTGSRARPVYRAAGSPLVGYPLLLAWQRGWLPVPRSAGLARLKDGRLLHCDLRDRTQRTMFLGLFEPEETKLVRASLRPGDVFVDVGAHIGWFTTLAARRVGAAGRVLACEPFPRNAAGLRQNLAENGCDNVDLVSSALGSSAGTLRLAGGDSGSITAVDWAQHDGIEVPMTTLDAVTRAAGLGNIALLKVDVEGWEPQVLGGGPVTLARTSRVLIEINRPALARAGYGPDDLIVLLRQSGFTTFVTLAERGLRRLRRADVTNLLATRG